MLKYIVIVLLVIGACFAQQPFKPVDGQGNELVVAASGTRWNSNLLPVTTTPSSITSSTLKVQIIHCANSSASAATITIKDNSSNTYVPAVSMAAHSVLVIHYGAVGLTYAGGVELTASANSAISCQVEGVR